MDEDAANSPDTEMIQWRRDASTSRTVRLLWSLGVGTFFAAIGIIVFWRLFDIAGQIGRLAEATVAAFFAALIVTAFAFAVTSNTEQRVAALSRRLPVDLPTGRGLERGADAVIGTVVMMIVIGSLMIAGRIVSQRELLEVGAGPFTGLAALTIPLALVALVFASFLRSVGALDREERTIYLYDPDQAIDLEVINAISTRQLGDATILTLEYAQPDGQYVAGPRRIVVPPAVAQELQSLVDETTV
ncbi:hypothetical protein [Natronorubrum bangense]|uniref:Uncharacterized protein n=2 Tax=Natronorubrum bangense TaxID=61858 RepID=L9WLE1_9EURY|nr:hypothetical protein [Natronorubrum bangense]ELY50006.1 hypothetical protein C494_06480 [Natronorubrum bangense JCM 10635]QCC54145.1 hypothetical protein DV706_06375 [Natronorubrum bangense]